MKTVQKCMAIVLIILLIPALCACGGAPDAFNGRESTERSFAVPDDGAAEEESAASRESGTPDRAGMALEKKKTDQSEASDLEEAAHLLDVVFYERREEAEAAAGGSLLASYESGAAGSESYNPMSWCYALITAVHDETVVMISRGYDRITKGDEGSGFFRNFTECYEFMDAGDQLVMQVNVEWYPVFQIDVSDADYKTAIPLGWDIYTSKDENGIPAPLKVTGKKIIYPIALYRENHYFGDEDATAHYPEYTYGSDVELIYADEDHPELARRLEEMNAEIDSEYEEGLSMLGLEAAEGYASAASDGNEYYSKNLRTSLCRADDTVLSFVRYYDTYLENSHHSSARGFNLDTGTGRDIRLDEVLTDVEQLADAVYERCTGFGFEDDVSEAYRDVTRQYVEDGDYISSAFFSWNICYEGLWLHFNDSVPQEILYHASGRSSVFLPFSYYPEMFEDKYTNVPESYCYDIESHPEFGDYYALELEKDGRYIDFALRANSDSGPYAEGFTNEFSIEIDFDIDVIKEGISCLEYDTFVVHSTDLDYLYIHQIGGEDTSECTVYQLSHALFYEGTTEGSVNDLYVYGDWNDHSNGINCRIMTDPTHFLMTRRDNRLGYGIIYAYHELARSGEPMKSDDYWTYAFNGSWELYPLKDMKISAVNEDCEITGETTLLRNTRIRPYRTDSYSWVDVIDQKGNIYRIETDRIDGNPPPYMSIDGKSPEEIFGGISR